MQMERTTRRLLLPARRALLPRPRALQPRPREQFPTSREEFPRPREELPTPREQFPTSREELPRPREQFPTPRDKPPRRRDQHPTPRQEHPAPPPHPAATPAATVPQSTRAAAAKPLKSCRLSRSPHRSSPGSHRGRCRVFEAEGAARARPTPRCPLRKPEGLHASSRGSSESASATPGWRASRSDPEGVIEQAGVTSSPSGCGTNGGFHSGVRLPGVSLDDSRHAPATNGQAFGLRRGTDGAALTGYR